MDIIRTAENTILTHRLISDGDRILVALSGGADSTALLHILYSLREKYNITLACAHVNHGLRKTADRDTEFCRELCRTLGVELFCLTADIRGGAKQARMSEELYARNVRYDYFASLGFDKIATAHNKNDAAETLLFNFMRGSTVRGLSGIPYIRKNVIRPLLDIKKSDITAFCEENGYGYVTDETNFESVYTRNKIRLKLIPEIERDFNPNFVDVASANAKLFREDSDFLEELAEKEYIGEIYADKISGLPLPIARRVLEMHWKKYSGNGNNLSAKYIDALLSLLRKNQTGKSVSLPYGLSANLSYGKLIIKKRTQKKDYEYEIYPGKILFIPETEKNILITKSDGKGDFCLADTDGLTVRNRRQGDIFYPKGMTGRKKLSDYFTDKKIPSEKRGDIPLLTKNGEIVSVGNLRTDRRFSDTDAAAYKMKIWEAENAE